MWAHQLAGVEERKARSVQNSPFMRVCGADLDEVQVDVSPLQVCHREDSVDAHLRHLPLAPPHTADGATRLKDATSLCVLKKAVSTPASET